MEYRINYGFLKQWLEANPQIKKNDVLRCLNIRDYTRFNKVVDGILPMNIEAMVRMCNSFNIPLSCWFLNDDDDERAQMPIRRPIKDVDLPMPIGGFPDEDRRTNSPRCSPLVDKKEYSTLPMTFDVRMNSDDGGGQVVIVSPSDDVEPDMANEPVVRHEDGETESLKEIVAEMLTSVKNIDRILAELAEKHPTAFSK